MAKATKKTSEKKGKTGDLKGLWKIYGSRVSKSGERINISIIRADSTDDDKKFACITLPKEGSKSVKVKVKDYETIIRIPRLDVTEEDEEDEEDFEED